jgi:dynein heavy chain, axonemal
MPIKEKYGAQPPIEFLRQIIDQKGYYDLKEKDKGFKTIIDANYIYGMAAINNTITPRFLRHTTILSVTNFDEDTLTRIFTTILTISFQGHPEQRQIGALLKHCI